MRLPRFGLTLLLFLRASRVQRKRAILTIAAIAWGSLSLLLLLSFGEGLRRQMELARAGMGEDIAVMWPGETTLPWQGLASGRAIQPRIEDVELLRTRLPDLAGVCGELTNWRAALSHGGKTVNGRLTGTNVNYGELRNHIPQAGGRWLNPLDEQLRRRVIFLGDALAVDLFGKGNPVGQTLLVDDVPYTVIGVMTKKLQMGAYGGMDKDHALIPISTFYAQYGRDRLSNLLVRADRPEHMEAALAGVREVLGGKYGFDPTDDRALATWDTVKTSATFRNMLIGIQTFLGVIGVLTLIVGGIGVANIMYAVVKERTREIGVKMALGARSAWITGPIVLEGLTYTLLGGVIGLTMASAIMAVLQMIPTEGNTAVQMLGKPTLSAPIAMLTAGVLGFIGLLAGYFPARRAASVDPAETLRYE